MDPKSIQEDSTPFQSVPIVARASLLCLSSVVAVSSVMAIAIVKQVQQMLELAT